MRRVWPFAVVLAACYSPKVSPGAPCGPSGECPSGLACISGMCLPPGTVLDDGRAFEDAPADTIDIDAAADAMAGYVPWGTPTAIPSLNAVSGSSEDDPSFTANKLTVALTSQSPDEIYECTRTAIGAAFTCTILTTVNSTTDDKSPEISADGNTLYFISDRSGAFEVYVTTKGMLGWSTPVLATDLSSSTTDDDLAISPDGLTAVVGHDQGQNHFVFYTRASTALPFATPVTHTELEITGDIASMTITNGGAKIYFHAGGTRDIYVAYRMPSGTYSTPSPVTELNTAGRDAAPFVAADDKYMMFERGGDIFETSRP